MSFKIVEQAPARLNRSELAVPGSQPQLFEKAAKSAADVIFLDLEDAADDEGAVDAGTHGLDRLHLEAGTAEPCCHVAARFACRDGDELTKPRQGRAHQASRPNAREKRMSPSTMSRMSLTPLRNIRVRSTPMPKANPR